MPSARTRTSPAETTKGTSGLRATSNQASPLTSWMWRILAVMSTSRRVSVLTAAIDRSASGTLRSSPRSVVKLKRSFRAQPMPTAAVSEAAAAPPTAKRASNWRRVRASASRRRNIAWPPWPITWLRSSRVQAASARRKAPSCRGSASCHWRKARSVAASGDASRRATHTVACSSIADMPGLSSVHMSRARFRHGADAGEIVEDEHQTAGGLLLDDVLAYTHHAGGFRL